MKHIEKLDLVLFALYEKRFEPSVVSLEQLMKEANIPYENDEPRIIGKRLESDGLVKAEFSFDDSFVEINSYGIEYCEAESYSDESSPVINIVNVINSPNANVVNTANQSVVYTNKESIKSQLDEIRQSIALRDDYNDEIFKEIGEYLDEIDEKVQQGKSIPKFMREGLLSKSADVATLAPYVIKLIKEIGS